MRITLTIHDEKDAAEALRMAARCLERATQPTDTIYGRDGMYLLAARTKAGGLSFRQCNEKQPEAPQC